MSHLFFILDFLYEYAAITLNTYFLFDHIGSEARMIDN